ncbi:sodium/potassium-transporting ATPase subunit beta-1-like [Ptychodera flava]|uniref:sodium/potassium-transporting ATPase subunit beta-1-like n=1 Tax=Ptychodera flava TaxID=63121 RepID=UPI003969E7F0
MKGKFLILLLVACIVLDGASAGKKKKPKQERDHKHDHDHDHGKKSKEKTSQEEGRCDLNSYCENEDTCAYTLLVTGSDDECQEIRETIADVQELIDRNAQQDEEIHELQSITSRLTDTVVPLEENLQSHEERLYTLECKLEEAYEFYNEKIEDLYNRHRFQGRRINKLEAALEECCAAKPTTEIPTEKPQGVDLLVVPNTDFLQFSSDDKESYSAYTQEIEELLQGYSSSDPINYDDCASGTPGSDERSCYFSLNQLTEFCTGGSYGYSAGKPCLYFHLSQVPGWIPEPYTINDVPVEIKDIFTETSVPVTCKPRGRESRANDGLIKYYHQDNIDIKYFPVPNNDQEVPYLSPLIAVRLRDVATGSLFQFECKAWARNINHDNGEGVFYLSVRVTSQEP